MQIRLARKEDKEAVLSLAAELLNTANEKAGHPLISVSDVGSHVFDQLLSTEYAKIFVAEENNTVVGMATIYILPTLRRKKPQGKLEELVVTKKWRGKGVGKQLFQAALDYCKQHNAYALKLTSALELVEAHEFYENQGGKFTEKMFRFDI